MIASYINNETKKEVYVSDFTANLMEANGKKSKDDIVIYKYHDDFTTFVIPRKTFDKEFSKKLNK
jgi:hypothetical protein